MINVTDETRNRIEVLFSENEWNKVESFLESECGDNLPLVSSDYDELTERIRFSVLKLSGGDYNKLLKETTEATKDWRDTLMAAGFGNDTKAHLSWSPVIKK